MELIKLVATSWSAKVVIVYAQKYPDRVSSLTLIAPGLCPQIDISLRERIGVKIQGTLQPNKMHAVPILDASMFTENPEMICFIEPDPWMLKEEMTSFFLLPGNWIKCFCQQ
jgi:pimeloyl-ACP methyl ester carboxylesterase